MCFAYLFDNIIIVLMQLMQLMQIINIFINIDSPSPCSRLTEEKISLVRYSILNFFNANPDLYDVIFTSGATSSLKIGIFVVF